MWSLIFSLLLPLEYRLDLVTLIQRIECGKGKNSNFTVKKPGKYYLNEVIRVNIARTRHVDIMCPLI